jgi:hypothetical protein
MDHSRIFSRVDRDRTLLSALGGEALLPNQNKWEANPGLPGLAFGTPAKCAAKSTGAAMLCNATERATF